MKQQISTIEKASHINQDEKIYGTIAEIGAGQEVARQFFEAGRASRTIAKTISAYDMTFSDSIYGPEESGRYVCQSRVEKMLEYEYGLVEARLKEKRGKESTFFAYANTLTTGSKRRKTEAHGWVGLRFQTRPNGPVNQVVAHIKMKNRSLHLQKETVGILSINLIHACFFHLSNMDEFIDRLKDNIDLARFELDFIEFSGEEVQHIDNRMMSLKIVQEHLTPVSIFSPEESVLQIADTLYKKDVLVLRGNFQPITNVHVDMLDSSQNFLKQKGVEKPVVILELTLKDLQNTSHKIEKSFMERIEALNALGHPVVISNYFLFYELKQYIEKYTSGSISMVIGANLIPKLLEKKYYQELEGGILEGLGKLLSANAHLLIYPYILAKEGKTTFASMAKDRPYQSLMEHIQANYSIHDLECANNVCRDILSEEVFEMIQKGEKGWEEYVPQAVATVIKEQKLFGYQS